MNIQDIMEIKEKVFEIIAECLEKNVSDLTSKSPSKEKQKSTANILFGYPSSGRCFACNVQCSISRSGNSPNKYVPYMASYKKLRKDITYYDGEKYGYYQYKSRFDDNN